MGKWLNGWFAWRFGLTRLMVAMLFLGAYVGLNLKMTGPFLSELPSTLVGRAAQFEYYWGWPVPLLVDQRHYTETKVFGQRNEFLDKVEPPSIPWTHSGHQLLEVGPSGGILESTAAHWPGSTFSVVIAGVFTNFLFGLAVSQLILFLQIPRRKAARLE